MPQQITTRCYFPCFEWIVGYGKGDGDNLPTVLDVATGTLTTMHRNIIADCDALLFPLFRVDRGLLEKVMWRQFVVLVCGR